MSYQIGPDMYDRYDFTMHGGHCKCGARASKAVIIVAEGKQYMVELCESCNASHNVYIAVNGLRKYATLIPKWAKDGEEYMP